MISCSERYLVAIDLDGTLLNDDKTISPLSVDTLKTLELQGSLVVLCSGRALRSVSHYHDNVLKLKTSPVICYNGHLATNLHDSSFPNVNHIMNKDSVRAIYKELIDKKLIFNAMGEDTSTIYCDTEDEVLFMFYDRTNMKIINGALDKTINNDVFTCVMRYDMDNADIEKEIKDIVSKYPDIEVRFWFGGEYCELFSSHVSKSKTILEVAGYYNIDTDHIIVFGDSDNDIEMLSDYKHSYLMKNGNPTLRDKAKHITEFTNNDDGVARELIKLFNIRL